MWMTLALLGEDAVACGGFACNLNRPVLQAAERIVFGVDEAHDLVEMHVQITYTGDAEDFAWIVPVPDVPDLFLTSGALFNRVALATAPRFVLNSVDEGWCRGDGDFMFGGAEFAAVSDAAMTTSAGNGGVSVIDQKVVGPYETVTLRATSSEALLGWLDANAFDLPEGSEEAIAPYVSEAGYFVALKLKKGSDVGDLAPLALRYEGDRAIVPVQLTSVSATPDMRLEAYVFANTRAVPESYLHVQINDAAIDWWNQGINYSDVITEAANEAGGHAFATDYYGASSIVRPLLDEAAFDEASIRASTGPVAWLNRIRPVLLAVPPEMFEVLEDQLALGEGMGATYYNCPDCVGPAEFVGGVDAATDVLLARVIEPARTAQNLLDQYPLLSRMTSSLDAAEMTVDPTFVLNHDMKRGEVSRRRTADQVFECGNGRDRFEAPRRLVLADGREIELPSQAWLMERGMTELQYLEELGDQKAQVIEQTGQTGAPEVIADFTADLFDLVDAHNSSLGCGCASTGTGAGSMGGLALLGVLALRRRR
ncbi:MAG: DUF2330 domain-containing protein [Myxococcota bacterium]